MMQELEWRHVVCQQCGKQGDVRVLVGTDVSVAYTCDACWRRENHLWLDEHAEMRREAQTLQMEHEGEVHE